MPGKGPVEAGPAAQLLRVRRACLSMPGAIEKLSHGAPAFFTPARMFATFENNHHNSGRLALWIPAAPGEQEAMIAEAPDTYFRPPYLGVSGWVGVHLARVDDAQLGALVREAHRLIVAKVTRMRT